MPQYRRVYIEGGTYFFTLVTYKRRSFLTDATARKALRQSIQRVRQLRPFTIDAMVLLPDHLHTVWTLPNADSDFSNRWRQIKTLFTRGWLEQGGSEISQSTNREVKGEHGIWQRRFYEHACRDEADMKHCIDYVHVNPLRHGLVESVSDWPWSTFHRYVRLGEYEEGWGSAAEWYGDEWNRFE